jgi:hypothetical protein
MSGWPYRQEPKVVNNSSSAGVGVGGLTFIVFLVLKLLGKITWSWWWVTAPLWGGFALVLACLALFCIGAGIYTGVGALSDLLRKR